jgi:MFS family permease
VSAAKHDPYSSLRIPNFRWFIVGLWAQTIAGQIQALVVGWQVYERTKDPLYLGMIGLTEALPFIVVALYAGHVADRRARKPVALLSTLALFGCALALLAFALWPDPHHDRIWPLYAIVFVSGIARSFFRPAATALSA